VSLLHRNLYKSEEVGVTDVGRYVEDLCENLIASMGEGARSRKTASGPVMLSIERTIPVGLILPSWS